MKRATEALVRAAKKLKDGEWDDDESDVAINQRMVGGIAQVSSQRIHLITSKSISYMFVVCVYCGIALDRNGLHASQPTSKRDPAKSIYIS